MGSDTYSCYAFWWMRVFKAYPAPLVNTLSKWSHTELSGSLTGTQVSTSPQWMTTLSPMWVCTKDGIQQADRQMSQRESSFFFAHSQCQDFHNKSLRPSVSGDWESILLRPIIWHPQLFFWCFLPFNIGADDIATSSGTCMDSSQIYGPILSNHETCCNAAADIFLFLWKCQARKVRNH